MVVPIAAAWISYYLAERAISKKENSRLYIQIELITVSYTHLVCPVFYYKDEKKHDIWGNIKKALIGYSSDKKIRFKAASGCLLYTSRCV